VCETAEASNEWCTRNLPVLETDEAVFMIGTNIHKNAE
jgi:hypothetical protein